MTQRRLSPAARAGAFAVLAVLAVLGSFLLLDQRDREAPPREALTGGKADTEQWAPPKEKDAVPAGAAAVGDEAAAPGATVAGGTVPERNPAANPRAPDVANSRAALDAQTGVEELRIIFRDFRTLFGENPTGTNAEITAALDGANPKGARLLTPEAGQRGENGELLDVWGTPYFFHSLSAQWTEVRSAGPDRRMWTPDDIKTDGDPNNIVNPQRGRQPDGDGLE